MANDLKVIPKQFITQPMDLGRTDAFSRLQSSLTQLSDYAAGEAGKIFLDEAKKKGEKKAFSNIGKPQKSAPGLTGATKAENEAYLSATSKLLSVNLNSLLTRNTEYVTENLEKLGQRALPKLAALNNATMEGFESQVPDELKHDMQYQFILGQEKTMAYMMTKVSAFNNKKAAESFTATFTSDLKNVTETIFSGDQQGAEEAYAHAKKTIQDYKTLGKISEVQEQQFNSQLSFAVSDARAVSGFLRARAQGSDAEAEYLHDAATEQPTGVSREQWVSGQSAIAKEMSRLGKLEVEHYSAIKSEISNGIATGRIATEDDLKPYYNKLPASVIMDFRTKMLKANDEDNKLQVKIDNHNMLLETDPGAATLTPDNVKDAAFEQKLQPLIDRKIAETGDPNAKLNLREMVPIVRQEASGIRLFTAKMEYGLKSEIPAVRQDAILAYKDLNGSTGHLGRAKALQVDAMSDRIAYMALGLAGEAGNTLDSAMETAQKSIMLINDSQRFANIESYKAKFVMGTKGVKGFNNAFKNASGVDAANNSFASVIYRNLLSANCENMPSMVDAENLTNLQFNQSFSTSAYNKDPSQVMQYSPELVVDKAQQGRWLKNQEILQLYGVVKGLENAPIYKVNLDKNLKRVGEISSQIANQPLSDMQRVKLNKEFERLNKEIGYAAYDGPDIKWTMGTLKDSYTENELLNTDILIESTREKISRGRGGISEEGALGLAVGQAFSNRSRSSRRPTIGYGGQNKEVYLSSSLATMNREDGLKEYSWEISNGIGAPLPLGNPLNKSENPQFKGNATFVVTPFEKFLPKTAKTMNDKTISQMTEKEQNALFSQENPLSFWEFTFNKKNAIEERFNKKAAFKKKHEAEAKARKGPPK